MALIKKVLDSYFGNRGDAVASMNSRLGYLTYPRALRAIAIAGMITGVSEIYFFLVMTYLHWPFAYPFVLFATLALIFLCMIMMNQGMHSTGSLTMWLAIAIANTSNLFQTMHFPGGGYMSFYGSVHIIAILCAIGFLAYLPQEYKWAKKVLAYWTILPQLALLVAYYGRIYVRHYVRDTAYPPFEPAIPYADNNIYRYAGTIAESKLVLICGLVILACSIYLYIVARRQCKNG